jgi:hypothetical protein
MIYYFLTLIGFLIFYMKRLLLFVPVLFSTLLTKAQDTLIKRNGDTLAIRLTEINPDNLKYKRFDYQDGPLFTIQKEEVKLIIYQNGKKELFDNYVPQPKAKTSPGEDLSILMSGKYFYYKERRIREPDMLSIVYKLNDKRLNTMGKNVERLKLGQNLSTLCAASLFVYGIYEYQSNSGRAQRRGRRGGPPAPTTANLQGQNNGKILMLCGLVSGLISISFMIDRRKHDHFVVNAYNKYIGKP